MDKSLRNHFDTLRKLVDKPTSRRAIRILMGYQSKCLYLGFKDVHDPFFAQLLYENYMAKAERAFSDKDAPECVELGNALKGLIRNYYQAYMKRQYVWSAKEKAANRTLYNARMLAQAMFNKYTKTMRVDLIEFSEKIRKECKFPSIYP